MNLLKGYRTYLIVGVAILYLLGARLGYWALDTSITAGLGAAAVLFLRASIADLRSSGGQAADQGPPPSPKGPLPLPIAILCGALALSGGCSVIRISRKPTGEVKTTAYMPAWPWQDSSRTIERLNVQARTNSTSISMHGLAESDTANTNKVFEDLVSAAVSAAVKAAVKP